MVIGSPSTNNSCYNHGAATRSAGTATSAPGSAVGTVLNAPVDTPLNHCGGADIPRLTGKNGVVAPDYLCKVPKPEAEWFATNSEIVPCFKLTKAMFSAVKSKQDADHSLSDARNFILSVLFTLSGTSGENSASPDVSG